MSSFWGNTDRANNEPLFPENREVREVAVLITANATALGTNEIVFTTSPAVQDRKMKFQLSDEIIAKSHSEQAASGSGSS